MLEAPRELLLLVKLLIQTFYLIHKDRKKTRIICNLLVIGNTIPQEKHVEKCSKIKVIDYYSMFAEAIRRICNDEGVSKK